MWFAYIDESKEDNNFFVYSALIVNSDDWSEAFEALKGARKRLRERRGVYMTQELHAWKFASGKGRIANRPILRPERAEIFRRVLSFLAETKLFRVMSSVNTDEFYAFDRLVNRLNRTAKAKGKKVLLICDEGQEAEFTRRLRKSRVHNPIPSKFGAWSSGTKAKSIPTDQILEDPFFKDSKDSYFIQAVDFIAYALLRTERPIDSRTVLGYDTMYKKLEAIVFKEANENDPKKLGIIR
ncbi:MAG: DUF3800 domain-containing protein [Pseudorhodoplanes sp.]